MFGLKKKRTDNSFHKESQDRFYILVFTANNTAAYEKMYVPLAGDTENTPALVAVEEGHLIIVTAGDPDALQAQYLALGFKGFGKVSIPRQRPNETAVMVAHDLLSTGQHREFRQLLMRRVSVRLVGGKHRYLRRKPSPGSL